jgi:hypothetical protein
MKRLMKNLFVLMLIIVLSTMQMLAQSQLNVEIKTGDDDLRGGGDNANLVVNLKSKRNHRFENINQSRTWHNNTTVKLNFDLPADVKPEDISGFTIEKTDNSNHTFTKDNWNVGMIRIRHTYTVNGIASTYELYYALCYLCFRLKAFENGTTVDRTYLAAFPPTKVYDNTNHVTMRAIFRTGGDDLRGGNDDNLNLFFYIKNQNYPVAFYNINAKRPWGNNSTKQFTKDFAQNVNFDDIESVKLVHTGGNGMGADNWDLEEFTIYLAIAGREQLLITKTGSPPLPLQRFTGDYREKMFTIERNR